MKPPGMGLPGMNALMKTLFGDAWNIAGVAAVVAVGAGLASLGRPAWAVVAMPAAALCVVAVLACR